MFLDFETVENNQTLEDVANKTFSLPGLLLKYLKNLSTSLDTCICYIDVVVRNIDSTNWCKVDDKI